LYRGLRRRINRNLLIIADILIVNKPFAQANPAIVRRLVDALLYGNGLVRDQLVSQLPVLAKAFKWAPEKTREELTKVHLSNLPENLAFFTGAIDSEAAMEAFISLLPMHMGRRCFPTRSMRSDS
jgi:NitT/TauT family transport system substrate-binding protein